MIALISMLLIASLIYPIIQSGVFGRLKELMEVNQKPKYQLRKNPITTEVPMTTFKLNEDLKPIEYVKNNFKNNEDGTISDHNQHEV